MRDLMTNRWIPVGVLVLALLLSVGFGAGVGSPARALPEPSAEQAGATFPYAGRLNDHAGQPVADGAYDFTFTLYDTVSGGEPLWSEVQDRVVVKGGSFAVSLGSVSAVPPAVLDGQTLWLAVEVRGPGEAEFTVLNPRQRLNTAVPGAAASPSANGACPHDHFGEQWSGSSASPGLDIRNGGTGNGLEVWMVDEAHNGVLVYSMGVGVQVYEAGKYGVLATSIGASYPAGSFTNKAAGGVGLYAAGGDNEAPDLVLGKQGAGDDGRIYSAPAEDSSDILLFSNDEVHVHLDEDDNSDGTFTIYNGANSSVFQVTEAGAVTFGGEAGDYGARAVYAVQATGNWIEDFGGAYLVNGQATVTIEPVFAEMVNLNEYHVFLTSLGDCPLYIADKTPTSFTVKAMDGQGCSIAFDYRLVAKRLGNESARLEPAETSRGEDDDD